MIVAALVIFDTLDFPSFISSGQKLPGPNFVPVLLSILLIICGMNEILIHFLAKRSSNQPKKPLGDISHWGNQNVMIIMVSLILYVLIVQKLGFVITTFLFSLMIMIRLKASWLKGSVVSALLVIVILLLFTKLFKVPLPEGLFTINF